MAQRDVLMQAINTLNTAKGPAKIYYATAGATMPGTIQGVCNPTSGAPTAPWVSFGLTRGGINVTKNLNITDRSDVDQISGVYDQDIQDIGYALTTQLAEILDRTQMGMAADMGVPTIVATAAPTQYMVPLDDGDLKTAEWRWAVVFPKATAGKVMGFVFRRGALSGGDKVFRFDKSDPISPALEVRFMPEISTAISADQAYGLFFDIP
jgi:hypothetical protein